MCQEHSLAERPPGGISPRYRPSLPNFSLPWLKPVSSSINLEFSSLPLFTSLMLTQFQTQLKYNILQEEFNNVFLLFVF